MQGDGRTEWWQSHRVAASAVVLTILPLVYPAIPPLIDLPGHLGGYRILADAGGGPLARHYAVQWTPIGNLGVEGLVLALRPLLDVEPATHLVVALIPALVVAAMLWLGREAHGRVPPAAGFALPLAYALPFQLGFVNFSLAAALAMAGLALWLRLARTRADWVRIVAFVPIAGVVWLCHSFGWAMLGLVVLGAEWVIRGRRGERGWRRWVFAGLTVAPMAWPQALAMIAGEPMVGGTGDWFHWAVKVQLIASLLRERWMAYDLAGVVVLALVLWGAIRSKRLSFDAVLGVPALLLLAAFVLLPRFYAGGSYVDMRPLPYGIALALLAIRVAPGEHRLARRLAVAGAGFFVLRTATSVVALALFASEQRLELGALPAMPVGSAVLTLVDQPPIQSWQNRRLAHVAGVAVARRRVFTNEQWAIGGQQPIRPLHPGAAPFDRDPSQLVYPPGKGHTGIDLDDAVARFDRGTFDYVWTIGFPPGRARAADLSIVWSNGRSALYRVDRALSARRPAR